MENVIKDITVSKEIKTKKEDKDQDEEVDDKINKIESNLHEIGSKNEIDSDKEFSEVLEEKADIESDIKQIDEDPDKLNLETIEIDTLKLDDEDSIELDIEEL